MQSTKGESKVQIVNMNVLMFATKFITIINNWFDELCLNCTPNVDLKDYLKVEVGLVENNYELIEKVEYFEELQFSTIQIIQMTFIFLFDVLGLAIYGLVFGA
jgi:hypothetical protein